MKKADDEMKENAAKLLSQLDVSLFNTINIYSKQISFALPKVPASMNTDEMTVQEIYCQLQEGLNDIETGQVQDASVAFCQFRECL